MKARIEKRLSELVPEGNVLFEAARYALLGGGKRLRPQLVLIVAKMFGASEEIALDPACAIEMVHAYSLIHDDLPCMDDDDLRHGKPSLHKAFSEPIALLAGDFLLTHAFTVIANTPLEDSKKVALTRILSQRGNGMIDGQIRDIQSAGKEIGPEELFTMHRGKTAALLTACLEFGALLAGKTTALEQLGENIGLAYQILDDLLDATSTSEQLGKTAGSDAKHQKSNAVTILGFNGAKELLESLKVQIFKQIDTFPASAPLSALTQKLLIRNY